MVWHRCVMYSTPVNGGGLKACGKTPSQHKTEQGLARAQILLKDQCGSSLPARGVTEDKHLGSLPGGSTWDLHGFLYVRTRADGSARPVPSRTS